MDLGTREKFHEKMLNARVKVKNHYFGKLKRKVAPSLVHQRDAGLY